MGVGQSLDTIEEGTYPGQGGSNWRTSGVQTHGVCVAPALSPNTYSNDLPSIQSSVPSPAFPHGLEDVLRHGLPPLPPPPSPNTHTVLNGPPLAPPPPFPTRLPPPRSLSLSSTTCCATAWPRACPSAPSWRTGTSCRCRWPSSSTATCQGSASRTGREGAPRGEAVGGVGERARDKG